MVFHVLFGSLKFPRALWIHECHVHLVRLVLLPVSSSVTEEVKQSSWLAGTVSILQVTVKWLQSFWSTLHLLFAHSFLAHRHVIFLLFVTFTEQVCICKQSHKSADFSPINNTQLNDGFIHFSHYLLRFIKPL